MDLSSLLESPKINYSKRCNNKLAELDKVLEKINTYNTEKVDIDKLNKEAKLEAKKFFYKSIDELNLDFFPNLNNVSFDNICQQMQNGFKYDSIFKNEPYSLFSYQDVFKKKNYETKDVLVILNNQRNNLKSLKLGLKMISIESDLNKILKIKKALIEHNSSASLVEIYATLIKILLNYGIDLNLMESYIIKYANIKDNSCLKKSTPLNKHENFNPIQSFIHIVDLLEIKTDNSKIVDYQVQADFVSIVLILFLDKNWRYNPQCIRALNHFLVLILNRVEQTTKNLKVISQTIINIFKDKNEEFYEFLEFFPDLSSNIINIKFALCKLALRQYKLKIGHEELRIKNLFSQLLNLKFSNSEKKLILCLADNFFRTRKIDEEICLLIKNSLIDFNKQLEFETENQNSIDFYQYIKCLIKSYDKTNNTDSPKRKKDNSYIKNMSRPRKIIETSSTSKAFSKKIWEELETDFKEQD